MAALESILVGARNPQGEEPEYSAGLLKSRESLPFSFKYRQHAGMKRIGGRKGLARGVERKLLRHLLAMVLYPVPEFVTGADRIPVEQNPAITAHRVLIPLKEAAAYDFGSFRFCRHDHGFPA